MLAWLQGCQCGSAVVALYLNSYWMDCHGFWYIRSWYPEDKTYWLWWFSDFSFSATNRPKSSLIQWHISTSISLIGTIFDADIHDARRIFPNDFGDNPTWQNEVDNEVKCLDKHEMGFGGSDSIYHQYQVIFLTLQPITQFMTKNL